MPISGAAVTTWAFESVLGVVGALLALAATVVSWRAVGAQQVIHPLTVFYFVEAPGLALVGAWALVSSTTTVLAWMMAGALFGFCIVGGFSIGPAYFPADALLGVAALWHDRREWRLLPARVGLAVVAAVMQAVMMLLLVRTVGH